MADQDRWLPQECDEPVLSRLSLGLERAHQHNGPQPRHPMLRSHPAAAAADDSDSLEIASMSTDTIPLRAEAPASAAHSTPARAVPPRCFDSCPASLGGSHSRLQPCLLDDSIEERDTSCSNVGFQEPHVPTGEVPPSNAAYTRRLLEGAVGTLRARHSLLGHPPGESGSRSGGSGSSTPRRPSSIGSPHRPHSPYELREMPKAVVPHIKPSTMAPHLPIIMDDSVAERRRSSDLRSLGVHAPNGGVHARMPDQIVPLDRIGGGCPSLASIVEDGDSSLLRASVPECDSVSL